MKHPIRDVIFKFKNIFFLKILKPVFHILQDFCLRQLFI